ncbi:MAG TPA: hypothetical protein VMD28_03585 [Acidimicrobiales bacterium]|nr:hypothetical protein [Acidimicrobiales bacterium]
MSEVAGFAIGAAVSCRDGGCGELVRVVIDPGKNAVTHLVVRPTHRSGAGTLVPVELVESASSHEIRLRCTLERFGTLDSAEETDVTPGFDPAGTSSGLPMFGFRGSGLRGTAGVGLVGPLRIKPHGVVEDNIPAGEGEVSGGQHVHALDGPIGHVLGLVVDSGGQVTHVLLGEGHLWGKKEVAIPVSAVKTVADDGVYLSLTKKQLGDLPPADLERIV